MRTRCNDLSKLEMAIKVWAKSRGINKAHPKDQYIKVVEEVGEIAEGLSKKNLNLIMDAIGDTFVTLVALCSTLNIQLGDCVNMAYNEIKDRDGKMVDGVFVKEEDLEK